MVRRPREDAPGAAHHVMIRGIERRAIFLDAIDREDFLRRLAELAPALGFRCFAWALMPNHVHLVLRSGNARLSQLMARLGTGYARRFNERHERVGHLFQNRFRSRLALDDADLMGLVLYVSRNPLEAALVASPRDLEDFPWCGLGALLARRPRRPFESVEETLALFDADPDRARRRLRGWLRASQPMDATPEPMPADPAMELAPRAPACAPARSSATRFEALLGEVGATFGVPAGDLRSRSRSRRLAEARAALATRATAELGLTGAEIARRLGLTKAAVSVLLRRGRVTGADVLTF